MNRTGKAFGYALSVAALPLFMAAPVVSAHAHGYRDYGRHYGGSVIVRHGFHKHYGHHRHKYHHKHRHSGGGGGKVAAGLLGLGVGVLIGNALSSNSGSSGRTVVRERVVTVPDNTPSYRSDYGNGWYQPVSQPAQPAPAGNSCLQTREYQTRVSVGGEEVDAYGSACLQPDGSWQFGAPTPVPR